MVHSTGRESTRRSSRARESNKHQPRWSPSTASQGGEKRGAAAESIRREVFSRRSKAGTEGGGAPSATENAGLAGAAVWRQVRASAVAVQRRRVAARAVARAAVQSDARTSSAVGSEARMAWM